MCSIIFPFCSADKFKQSLLLKTIFCFKSIIKVYHYKGVGVVKDKRYLAFSDDWILDVYNFSCKNIYAYSNPKFAEVNTVIQNSQPIKGQDEEYEEDFDTTSSTTEPKLNLVSLGELGVAKCGVHPEFLF